MENVILIFILIVLITAILWYLIRSKRKGAKCVGCPYAKQCNGTYCSVFSDDTDTSH